MIRVVSAELLKLRTTRTPWILLGAALLVVLAGGILGLAVATLIKTGTALLLLDFVVRQNPGRQAAAPSRQRDRARA